MTALRDVGWTARAAHMLGSLAARCAARWRAVLLLAAIALVLSIFSLSRMRIDSSLEAMLGMNAQAAGAMHRVTTRYRSGDALMVLIATDAPASQTANDALVRHAQLLTRAIHDADRESRSVDWVRMGPDPALARFAAERMLPAGVFYLDQAGLEAFIDRVQPDRMTQQFARNESMMASPGPAGNALSDRVLTDPLRLIELVPVQLRSQAEAEFSTDGRAVLLRIGGRAPPGDLHASGTLHDLVQTAIDATRESARATGLRVEMGGAAAIATTASRTIRRDSIVSTLVSVALLYALFVLFYRRWFAALLIGAVAGTGMVAGFGLYAIFSSSVSPLAAAVSALLAGLGVDYGIHFLSHYDLRRAQGADVPQAIKESASHMALPIITNCMTSIFGFASLWASDIKMLRDFAMMGSAGLVGALVAVFVLMPALLALSDRGSRSPDNRPTRFGAVADVVAKRPRTWMYSTLILLAALLCIGGVQGLLPRLEADLTKLHPQPNAPLRVTNEIIARFGSQGEIVPVEVRADSSEALITAAHAAAARLAAPDCKAVGVEAVLGVHQLLPDPAQSDAVRLVLHRVSPEAFVADFNRAVESSAFRLDAYAGYCDAIARMLGTSHPPGVADILGYPSVAERLFPAEQLATAVTVRETVLLVRLATPLHDREVRDATVARLRVALADIPGTTLAGLPAVSMELEAATRTGLPVSIAVSLALVLLWLLAAFRDPLDVLLALVPLACAAVAIVSFMAITQTALNPINCVAIPLLDGIAVDAGVVLVAVFRSHGAARSDLVTHLRPTVHAVLLAVATTITGFASMCFTATPAIRSLGLVAGVGIAGSMIGAICVLMPLLMLRSAARSAH
ncbi:MAG: MMPL family transporter [Phycisphaerae bacterium]